MSRGALVISNILGGLGNQMFQYAAGRSLAQGAGRTLLLDLGDFAHYQMHNGFELQRVFGIETPAASRDEVRRVIGWRISFLSRRIVRRDEFSWLRGSNLIVESANRAPNLQAVSGDVYLMGYWQSELNFIASADMIRQDFRFREALSGGCLEWAQRIQNSEAVSLHVRRGDYVSDPKNAKVLNICAMDYCRAAVMYIAERLSRPVFYIFSDDIAWVKKNLKLRFPCHYIEGNRGAVSYRDMQLMSMCRHNVIANSSFSWWGAWLNSNEAKIVVAPQLWFSNGVDDSQLIPHTWTRLP
jgi:hypothetical protein